jgi:uncharacterized membrane protein
MSFAARIFTAFIAFCGIYHYLRLPFGPKRAWSYFQEMMAAVVLAGLIYFICEIYLDDCIVHASDVITFVSRLELIFERLEKHRITNLAYANSVFLRSNFVAVLLLERVSEGVTKRRGRN